MLDALKALFENNVLSNEVRQEIEEAWNSKVKENRLSVTAELREEFAQKYEHDKGVMVEAIDKMVSERLETEMAELAEDRKQLIASKAKYAVAMKENAKLLKTFVQNSLVNEVRELHEDQKSIAVKFKMLEDFVVDSLAKELAEFQTDKDDLAKTKVRLVKEAKVHLTKMKQKFIQNSAAKVTETVKKVLTREIGQLKEDITIARKNDFGRKLFEAFATEYSTSYLNSKSETAKLMKLIATQNKQLAEAKTFAVKAKKLVESKNVEIKKINESAKRQEIINELVNPLRSSEKEIMLELLESIQTDRLKTAFNKYLPTVIDGKIVNNKKAIITEGKEITGNKKQQEMTQGARDNVIDIRRLAGLN